MSKYFNEDDGFFADDRRDEDAPEDERVYNLIGGTRPRRRLRIVRGEGGSYFSIAYDDIHTLEGTADGKLLSLLIKGGLAITLTGERLIALADRLDEAKTRVLYVYQPHLHTLKNPITPVINAIAIETMQKQ
jgi:hypothetical protein